MSNCNAYCNDFNGYDLTWCEIMMTQLEADDLCVTHGGKHGDNGNYNKK
jgi:hypothetical protein